MTRALIALGSSIEPRHKYLQVAVEGLQSHSQVLVTARSRIYESQSVEDGGESDFLNAAIEIETTLSARELLRLCQSIESNCGREMPHPGEHRHGARTLDVDIVAFGDETSGVPELVLPHPRALWRPFVLRPVLDLIERDGKSGWVHLSDRNWGDEER